MQALETQHFTISGASRARTGDPLLAKQVLSQLSYGPLVSVTPGIGLNPRTVSAVAVVATHVEVEQPDSPEKLTTVPPDWRGSIPDSPDRSLPSSVGSPPDHDHIHRSSSAPNERS